MAVGAVVARILTQYSNKGSKAAQKDISKLGKDIDMFAKRSARAFGLAAAASAIALTKISKDSIMAASDLSQQFGALDAVFGQNSTQLKDFSKSMVDFGLSTADAARFAALLGTQLKGLGMEEQEAIDRTKQLQILAADLAATYGGTTADAVAALSSTFKGEYNPIERYGVAIRKSDITARVAAKGLGKLQGDLLKAAEAQAAFELIITRTTAAQGQSRREYNTLAAQLQRVNATFSNMKASLGTALLPIMEKFAGLLITKILPKLEAFIAANKNQLAASFAVAAEFALKFLEVAVAFGNWVANNTGTVKKLAAIIATMFVATKVYQMITAVNLLTAAFVRMNIAMGAGAIGAATKTAARAGALGTAGVALAGGSFFNNLGNQIAGLIPGTSAYNAKTARKVIGSNMPMSPSASDVMFGNVKGGTASSLVPKATDAIKDFTKALKAGKELQDALNKKAMAFNLAKQASLSGSSTIAIGGAGSLAFGNKGTNVVVNVAGSVSTEGDLITAISNGLERTTRRSFGGAGRFGTSGSQ